MNTNLIIQRASAADSESIAAMVGELLCEITHATGTQAFQFNQIKTVKRLNAFITGGIYFVLIARDASRKTLGFIALYECHTLYAEGTFGTIAEFYVRPEYRSKNVGHQLMSQAKSIGTLRSWKRLEVTTPPLPAFDRSLKFYHREGFSVTGGRKLKIAL